MAIINTKRILIATVVLLIIALVALTVEASDFAKTVSRQAGEIELLRTEIGLLDEQLDMTQYTVEAQYTEDIPAAGMLELHDNDMIISLDLPDEAALLLENLVTSLSTSDEALYRSLFQADAFAGGDGSDEYLMSVFYRYKGTHYTVRRISASVADGSPGYATVAALGDNGEYFYHQGVGITKDEQTGKWVIFDFD